MFYFLLYHILYAMQMGFLFLLVSDLQPQGILKNVADVQCLAYKHIHLYEGQQYECL